MNLIRLIVKDRRDPIENLTHDIGRIGDDPIIRVCFLFCDIIIQTDIRFESVIVDTQDSNIEDVDGLRIATVLECAGEADFESCFAGRTNVVSWR